MANITDEQIEVYKQRLETILKNIDQRHVNKVNKIINSIQSKCTLDEQSLDHARLKKEHEKNLHPIRPRVGEIYNILLSDDSVGKELYGNHLGVIVSNQAKNNYTEKVNIVPIEGDGRRIDPKNNIVLRNEDLERGHLDKDPSKIIGGDVMTIDKARLNICVGKVSNDKLLEIKDMIKAQLKL